MNDIEKLFVRNKEFRDYVVKYANKHRITAETAMTHQIVKNVGNQISEKEKRHVVS